jgi:hypothetical protein
MSDVIHSPLHSSPTAERDAVFLLRAGHTGDGFVSVSVDKRKQSFWPDYSDDDAGDAI